MDLIFWRHAEAEEEKRGQGDLQRALTGRGEKQAARMAQWLDRHMPEATRILCSPALRCEQTVLALGRKYQLREGLAPDVAPQSLLQEAGWPASRQTVLIVGHQPTLGHTVAHLMGVESRNFPIRKGAVWWLRTRKRNGDQQTLVLTAQSPELL